MYVLYILDTVSGYVSSLSPIKQSNRKRTKPATFFDMAIQMDPTTKVRAGCFCNTVQKIKFSIKDLFSKRIQLVTFTDKILKGKLYFSCSVKNGIQFLKN